MEDYIVRATGAQGQIRAFAATTRNLVEAARGIHNTSPVATAALGRLLTGGAMMGLMLKNQEDLLTLTIRSNGPIGGLTVTANAGGNVKGYVHHADVMLPLNAEGKLDVAGALGIGVLNVIKDVGLREPYVGQTILVTSEIAEDLTYYFANSEQVPSSVALGVLMSKDNAVKQAGGFIVQLMPQAREEVVAALEAKIHSIQSVTAMQEEGMSPEAILEFVLDGLEPKFHETAPVRFSCNCSKERVEKALVSMGKKELREMIEEGETIETHCHFCNQNYYFTVDELKQMLDNGEKTS